MDILLPILYPLQMVVVDCSWRYELKVGDRVDVQDSDSSWYDSEVVEVIDDVQVKVSEELLSG